MYMSATDILLKKVVITRERNRDYRWVYAVKNVICVENRIGFEMERIRKKGKQHDNADVLGKLVLCL